MRNSRPHFSDWLPFLVAISRLDDLEPGDALELCRHKSRDCVNQAMTRMAAEGLLTRTSTGAYMVNGAAVLARVDEIRAHEADVAARAATELPVASRRLVRRHKVTPAETRVRDMVAEADRQAFCAKMRADMDRGRM